MRDTEIGTPVTAADGDDAEFCDDDGGADGGCDFLACFDAEADVAFGVADDDDGFKAGALTGAGLLLHGFDLCGEGGVSLRGAEVVNVDLGLWQHAGHRGNH